KLREGLTGLLDGRGWELPADSGLVRQLRRFSFPSRATAQTDAFMRFAREQGFEAKVFSSYDGPVSAMVLWAAADLIAAEGARLALCGRGKCERPIFVRERPDQAYCSKRCSLLERTRRRRTETPDEELREARRRQYILDYARRRGIDVKAAAKLIRRRALFDLGILRIRDSGDRWLVNFVDGTKRKFSKED